VFPQDGINPEQYLGLKFKHFYIQPMDGPFLKDNTERAIKYCLQHPEWKLSLQTQKIINIP
jgi:7-carboxy-7-deazaguanine synthase